ncbi:MAG: RNA 2',3'-cyclic phosphodiesterase [Candidatus Omnitrophota bacterium]|nr:RNA 2',3'-cyclic phosphodiesterase [Candidatus Omnitrophota bacterium]
MSETIRSFIAIELSPENQEKISQIQRELKSSGADVKWVKPENIHLTLKFLGNVETSQIEIIFQILKDIAANFERFSFELNELGVFPKISSPRVIWFNCQEPTGIIAEIVLSLEEKLEKLGFAKEEREFTPHITIGRIRSSRGMIHLIDKLKQTKISSPIIQEVDKLTLFKSTLTPSGPIYEVLNPANLK